MYKKILLKLSGEALSGQNSTYDADMLHQLAVDLKEVLESHVQIAIVVGGGNVIRGKFAQQLGLPRLKADQMGMLATLMNALAISGALEQAGVATLVQSAIEADRIADIVNPEKANLALQQGKIVIYGGGTTNPYFSTDTATALRAAEIGADAILMAKNGVDGVYDDDPRYNPNAKRYETMTYQQIIDGRLKVMDLTAAILCIESGIPAVVFDMKSPDIINRIIAGEKAGTLITVK